MDAVAGTDAEQTLANSAAITGWPDTHLDWVRPGIMLYGGSPLAGRSAESLNLQPVMTLSTRLIAVNARRTGDAIGYGEDWVCPTDRLIGVAAIGYGDGYPRRLAMVTVIRGTRQVVPRCWSTAHRPHSPDVSPWT